MESKTQKLIFIDTNIWLDFYRARNETGLALLSHVEAVANKVIVTYQLESEFKRNRQKVILESIQELKAPGQVPRPGIFSDAKASEILSKSLREADKRVRTLKARLKKVIANPAAHDPVYQACQRVFHKDDSLVLTRENELRHIIRRKAFRRFLHGCPPRKRDDTSIGDAINWEWMLHCANSANAELVVVSRDSDYGVHFDDQSYINDHLKQEFAERVSNRRELLLYSHLSEALKHFSVPVTKREEEAERDLLNEDSAYVDWPVPDVQLRKLIEAFRSADIGRSLTIHKQAPETTE